MENFTKADIVLEKILTKYGLSKDLLVIYEIWEKVVGEKIAKKIQLCGIKGDTLLVCVETPAHHHYLKLYQKEWLKKINEFFLQYRDTNIKFKNFKVVKL
ncbi:MAG: DUF721 domain-containing protein [Endomicrobia bacterium]|nr:DUF721 domain-containing protein [Endomicrobiia bacterium]